MTRTIRLAIGVSLVVTIAAFVTWQVTGGDYYTKFEVIEQIESQVNPDDPLAGTGFYDDDSKKETVVQQGLRFGLLPTPNGLLDKHLISVASVATPPWMIVFGLVLVDRRRRKSRRARPAR